MVPAVRKSFPRFRAIRRSACACRSIQSVGAPTDFRYLHARDPMEKRAAAAATQRNCAGPSQSLPVSIASSSGNAGLTAGTQQFSREAEPGPCADAQTVTGRIRCLDRAHRALRRTARRTAARLHAARGDAAKIISTSSRRSRHRRATEAARRDRRLAAAARSPAQSYQSHARSRRHRSEPASGRTTGTNS